MARTRAFETEAALTAIKDAFWAHGFAGTSMQDIEAATGLHKQSLYRAFGDKRAMYLAALEDYERNEIGIFAAALRQPGSARDRFDAAFAIAIDAAIAAGDWRGCFLCNAAAEQAGADSSTRDCVGAMVRRAEGLFVAVLAEQPQFSMPGAAEARASVLLSAYFGLRVLVAGRAPATMIARARAGILDLIEPKPQESAKDTHA